MSIPIVTAASAGLGIGIVFLRAAKEPYAVCVSFLLFAIKGILLLRYTKIRS